VNQRWDRIDEKLNIQRLGFPFWKSHAGHYMPFGLFPNLLEFVAEVRPVSILSGAGMLARTLSDVGVPTAAR
jgi:GT2 family glycosyltransferase